MDTTKRLNQIAQSVVRINEIDVTPISSKEALRGWQAIMRSSYGVKEYILDGNAAPDGSNFFMLRCEVNTLIDEPTRYSQGTMRNITIASISNDFDRMLMQLESFLQLNTQYFVTHTDKYGRIYGKQKG